MQTKFDGFLSLKTRAAFDGNCDVGVVDLLTLLGLWGRYSSGLAGWLVITTLIGRIHADPSHPLTLAPAGGHTLWRVDDPWALCVR